MATRWLTLAQGKAGLAGELHQAQARLLVEPRVGGVGDRLLHDRRVHDHRLGGALADHAGLSAGLDRFRQQPFDALAIVLEPMAHNGSLPDPPAPSGQRRRVDRRAVLEEALAAEMLKVRVLDPAGDHRLVRQPVGVLEVQKPGHEPRRGRRPAGLRGEEPGPFPLEERPVDQRLEPDELVAHVDHVGQARAQQVVLFGGAGLRLHGASGIAGFRPES
jgi:hypothetical protein